MTTDQHADWTDLEIRAPHDVPVATPLSWQIEKVSRHEDRLFRNRMPTRRTPVRSPQEVEPGDAHDALAVLALRESIRRDVECGRGNRIHEALGLGATWRQVAVALDVAPQVARQVLREYADDQRDMWLGYEQEGVRPFGFTAEQHAAVLALCELGDDEAVPRPG
ncbi:hypothetical protein [Streptomyces sp. DH12]|uniref:hypothetical protein n=1 Tax=Streptomyces sp. DH12 TaxID=2857010 RepID=UPI001E4CE6DB|nr:hypothetical protein [Streptomyces sp. DH12]